MPSHRCRYDGRAIAALIACGIAAVGARAQQPTFRSGVELVAVDVQAVDRDGFPIVGLTRDDFQVSIEGRRRRIVSMELLRFDDPVGAGKPLAATAALAPATVAVRPPARTPADGRIYVLAVDTMSFTPAATLNLMAAARAFVAALQPSDLVGVVPFPIDRITDLTTDRARVIAALGNVVGTRMTDGGNCRLNPSDITDFTALAPGAPIPALMAQRIAEIMATAGPGCRAAEQSRELALIEEARMLARLEEAEIAQRLGSLRSMLRSLADSPRRKTIVLLSAGIITADTSGGRPDLGLDLGTIIGQDAARANATIYTLWADTLWRDAAQASFRGVPRTTDNHQRDAMLVSAPLDRITASSGGAMFNVIESGGEFAFDRVLNETSAHYLLGVEPEDADRDGTPRKLAVRVEGLPQDASIRARSWVVVPPATLRAESASPAIAPARVAVPPPPPLPAPLSATSPTIPAQPAPPAPLLRATGDSTLTPLLSAAGWYLTRFTLAFSNVVGEERYVQDLLGAGGLLSRTAPVTTGPRHRELRSDLVLVRSAGPLGWQMFRDVFEVDGTAVRDRAERLTRLFEQPAVEALDQAARIARESTRYNIGAAERTINSPVIALLFLQPDQQPRFAFSRGNRAGAFSEGVDVIEFREVARPTVIRTVQDDDRPASGRFWVERGTGAILQTELVLTGVGVSVRFRTLFRPDSAMNVAVPVRMEEEYLLPSGKLIGVATFGGFRRFTVNTDTTVLPAQAPR